ncbi:four-carbon acid sugar kinase family protein [Actomonas aquatica]|uniref:Four-carbon acid sugar kinase family protein n=1 Tax=Actomonas aquatica TaxID=2866162 RepID=A0ABZ1C9A6_9BACT|nr:four-carbon acid sugar kinase family protein [Opitutus sp. WL0086]WRQ88273.1 four-carbon acid sugar kinase family protein [Opitutus sp. WL0086]
MSLNLVFADDLTGACEIAGIAHRAGLRTHLSMDPETAPVDPAELVVVDTETRLLSAAHAAARIQYFATELPSDCRLFKKTDSVLRGPVAAETAALARHLQRDLTLLVPANPAFSRHIVGGHYRIGTEPLHRTPFGRDPLNPITTDAVVDILGEWDGPGPAEPRSLPPHGELPSAGLVIGDTADVRDLQAWARRVSPATLPAGGGAFFTELLQPVPLATPAPPPPLDAPTLLLSGTTIPAQRALLQNSPDAVPLSLDELSRRGDTALTNWRQRVLRQVRRNNRALVYVEGEVSPDPSTPGRITCAHAFLAECLAASFDHKPWHLFIEGGATAAAIASALGRRRFGVRHAWGPGVVTLQPVTGPFPLFTLKPGSYPWPAPLHQHFFPTPSRG